MVDIVKLKSLVMEKILLFHLLNAIVLYKKEIQKLVEEIQYEMRNTAVQLASLVKHRSVGKVELDFGMWAFLHQAQWVIWLFELQIV